MTSHLDTIPGMAAAFQLGRAEYLAQVNRIGEIWLRGMGTNFTGGTNIQKLCSYTNQPPGNMQFWGVANITTGWE